MGDQLTVADIIALFGAFYKDSGQDVKDILKKIFVPTATEKLFMRIPTVSTVIDKANVMISEVLQANQPVFVHKGTTTFEPERIILEDLMIDYAQTPQVIANTWLGFLANTDNDPKSAPLVKYILTMLIDQAIEDYEKNMFHAVKGVVTPGTATATTASFDGLNVKFKDYNTRGLLQVHAMGAPPVAGTANAPKLMVKYVEDFVKSIAPEYRAMIDKLPMSEANVNLYKQGILETYNGFYAQVKLDPTKMGDEVPAPIMFSSIMAQGLRSHLGTNAIWATLRNNAIMGVKNAQNENSFITGVKDNKLVQVSTSFWKGFGMVNPRWTFHNGQALS